MTINHDPQEDDPAIRAIIEQAACPGAPPCQITPARGAAIR